MKKKLAAGSSVIIFILLVNLLLLPDASLGEPRAEVVELICGNRTPRNYTNALTNFVDITVDISSQLQSSLYGTAVRRSTPDDGYALAQCYGDLMLLDCQTCYASARSIFPQCFPVNGARLFLDGCFLRADNYSFFQEYTGPNDKVVCGNRTRKNSSFQASARRALAQAISAAPNNNGYARAQVAVSGTATEVAYVLANCWGTLDATSCKACLDNASAAIYRCLPWSEGRALNTGCFMRYSDTNFLNPIPGNGSSTVTTTIIAASVVGLVIGSALGFYTWKHIRTQKRRGSDDAEKLAKILNHRSLNFKYSTLEKATGAFDEANKLGQGGYGTVYKGVLQDGREIAVKRLFFHSKHRAKDFYNEVNIISSIQHKNLVRLLGCSCSGPESLLVFELLPNNNLASVIFDPSKGKELKWEKRLEIIKGIAEGLVYLHENPKTRIIHRDIKASNILLDFRLHAKIADFGLARSLQDDKSHISTAVAGTLGYMAPEYLARGQLTEKADVYSFGVLLLEIVTGRQNNGSKEPECSEYFSLVTHVWKHFQQRTVEELFDPNLTLHNYQNIDVKDESLRVVHVGLLCTQAIASLRPSMSEALQMLVKKEEHLPAPTNPPFLDENTMELNHNQVSAASISHSILYPR